MPLSRSNIFWPFSLTWKRLTVQPGNTQEISSGQHPISCSLQVLKGTDDCAMCMWGKSVQRVERTMQFGVNSIQNWASENGFKFSRSKTVCIHICSHNGFFPEPTILLDKSPIIIAKEAKFIGLICYSKLTFKKHIQHLNVP